MQVVQRGAAAAAAVAKVAAVVVAAAQPDALGPGETLQPARGAHRATGSSRSGTRATATWCSTGIAMGGRSGTRPRLARPERRRCRGTATSWSTARRAAAVVLWYGRTRGRDWRCKATGISSSTTPTAIRCGGDNEPRPVRGADARRAVRGGRLRRRLAAYRSTCGSAAVPHPSTPLASAGTGSRCAGHDGDTGYFLSARHEVLAVDAETGTYAMAAKDLRIRRTALRRSGPGERPTAGRRRLQPARLRARNWQSPLAVHPTAGIRARHLPGDHRRGGRHAGSPSGHVFAVDAEHGALRWSTSISDDGRTTVYGPAANGVFVAAAYTEFSAPARGGIALLDGATGRLLWKRSFPPPDDPLLSTNWAGGPVFAADVVVVASGDGNIRGFDLETGDIRWTVPKLTGRLPVPRRVRPRLPCARHRRRPPYREFVHRPGRRVRHTTRRPNAGGMSRQASARRPSASPPPPAACMCRS